MDEASLKQQESADAVSDEEDLRLIDLVCSGDRVAFDRLVIKYRDRIVSFCVRMLGDFQEGEDAAQDTFLKVYGNIGRFKAESRFSTWLYRIAVNTCRNQRRSWWGRVWRAALYLDKPVIDGEGKEEPRELGDTSMLPSKDLERKTRATAIRAAIGRLPAIHRELVILRDIQGKSYEEIEAIAGVPGGTVRSRLARARAALQNELKGMYYE
jgi:RNA polymerase sigma-70 factor, ECF subfamily